jgi:hypothetical protein
MNGHVESHVVIMGYTVWAEARYQLKWELESPQQIKKMMFINRGSTGDKLSNGGYTNR